MIKTRPFDYSEQDYAALVNIWNAIWKDTPASVAFERRIDKARDPKRLFCRIIAELDTSTEAPGMIVATADYGQAPWTTHPQKFVLNIQVHPHHQRRGIGSILYNHILEVIMGHNPILLGSGTREDQEAAIRFLTQRGFKLASREPSSQLDPSAFEGSQFEGLIDRVYQSGIQIHTYRHLANHDPNYLYKLYELHCELEQDVPWHDEIVPGSFDQWAKSYENNPDLLEDGYLVAMDGHKLVGVSYIWGSQATDEILYTGFTGVKRPYRKKGIATAMKVKAIEFAQTMKTSSGKPPVIRTTNEENNPMFQINLRLGFKEQPAWLSYVKTLACANNFSHSTTETRSNLVD